MTAPMRLLFSTPSFTYAGYPRPGLPIIVGDDMRPLQPVQDFIVWKLLGQGKHLSLLTWEDYGRRLWDFFSFLGANGLDWDEPCREPGKSPLARYRNWSLVELKLSPKTVNGRLRIVCEFYEWASRNGLIDGVPFGYLATRRVTHNDLLTHARSDASTVSRPDLLIREPSLLPEFLSKEQLRVCRCTRANASTMLLFDLAARVGLRSCEARTFPLKYVFNPTARADCLPSQMIRVRLDPRDMWLKFNKPRDVDIPYSLMENMYSYTLFERNRLSANGGARVECLVLNVYGKPYTRSAITEAFKGLSAQVGFRVRAHMLRHSYAVHTLARLRQEQNFHGEPLLYVRDRLGHSSVDTTMIYLRQVNQLASSLVLALEHEFDELFGIASDQDEEGLRRA